MKILDEKGRLFGKVSIIDVIVVIFTIILCIVGIYKYINREPLDEVKKTKEKLIVTYVTEETPNFVVETLKEGKKAKESNYRSNLGTVVKYEVNPSISYATTFQGEYVKSTKEDYSSVEITIDSEGYFEDTGARIDGQLFIVGKYINIEVGEGIYWGRISSIKPIGG